MSGADDEWVRTSDAEREYAVTRLVDAVGQGRLTLADYSDRVGQAYTVQTRSELDRLLADLPQQSTAPPVAAEPQRTKWVVTPIGALERPANEVQRSLRVVGPAGQR